MGVGVSGEEEGGGRGDGEERGGKSVKVAGRRERERRAELREAEQKEGEAHACALRAAGIACTVDKYPYTPFRIFVLGISGFERHRNVIILDIPGVLISS